MVLRKSLDCIGVAVNQAADMKKKGGSTLTSCGTFHVVNAGHKAMNRRTLEPNKVKAGKTARFKASPSLKKAV